MRVLSAAEMQMCDQVTTERYGVASLDLMRNASAAVARFARELFPRISRVTVLCGRGNNGGDGMMAAQLLGQEGLEVTVVLLGLPDALKSDGAVAWSELKDSGLCRMYAVESEEDFERVAEVFDTHLILDAILGTGFRPPMQGLALAALERVERSKARVLAVDLPSGWPADETSARADGRVFPADAVITFTSPKPAHVFGELTRRWNQPVVVAPIGSPDDAVVSDLKIEWAGSAQRLYHAPRQADVNKGKFGHVLVAGGSFGAAGGKAGAPAMTSMAAMRAGAGLVTAAVPAPALPVVSGFAPELMTWPLEANAAGEILPSNASPERIAKLLKGITVLAVGPGLGQGPDAETFFTLLLQGTKLPVVIDADGLNILAKNPGLLREIAPDRTVVLTPHPGEMARLAGISTAEVQKDRLHVARAFATSHQITVVLKGARTLIAHPSGRVAVNTSGNPGMAKGGSGDVLTGVTAAMLAQFPEDVERAVEAAVFLHGLAADLAVRELDEHTLLATDSLSKFSQAFSFHSRRTNGYVWLQGLPRDSEPA